MAISIRNISKSYQEGQNVRPVLKDLSMQVSLGETVALLGASGSGKSTLLNVLSGLTEVDSGEVEVAGVALHKLDSEKRTRFRREKIGFVFQFFHLIPTLTVLENLRLPLELNGCDNTNEQERAADLLNRVGLAERAHTFPERLSGGEQQRVAICRALVHRPQIVLADEPTGNLDANSAMEILQLILALTAAEKASLVLVTHSAEIASHCQRTLSIKDGCFH